MLLPPIPVGKAAKSGQCFFLLFRLVKLLNPVNAHLLLLFRLVKLLDPVNAHLLLLFRLVKPLNAHLLLDSQQLDNVPVADFLQHLKLPHLHLGGTHVRHGVEGLHRNRLARVLGIFNKYYQELILRGLCCNRVSV